MGLNDYGDIQRGPVLAEKSRSKYAAKWEAAIAERNTPFQIPCTFVAPAPDEGSAAPGVDFICVGFAAVKYLFEQTR